MSKAIDTAHRALAIWRNYPQHVQERQQSKILRALAEHVIEMDAAIIRLHCLLHPAWAREELADAAHKLANLKAAVEAEEQKLRVATHAVAACKREAEEMAEQAEAMLSAVRQIRDSANRIGK